MQTTIAAGESSTTEPRRGRPPLSRREPSVRVSVRLTVSTLRRLEAIAARKRCDVSEALRGILSAKIDRLTE